MKTPTKRSIYDIVKDNPEIPEFFKQTSRDNSYDMAITVDSCPTKKAKMFAIVHSDPKNLGDILHCALMAAHQRNAELTNSVIWEFIKMHGQDIIDTILHSFIEQQTLTDDEPQDAIKTETAH